jgi:hypothetical protein
VREGKSEVDAKATKQTQPFLSLFGSPMRHPSPRKIFCIPIGTSCEEEEEEEEHVDAGVHELCEVGPTRELGAGRSSSESTRIGGHTPPPNAMILLPHSTIPKWRGS